jgi:hypothetical protein
MATKYKNPPIWAKFGFQVDYDVVYSYKVDHNMAPKPWISIPNIKIYLETKFHPNWRIFVFWRPFWIQNGLHSKLTMDINSQHAKKIGIGWTNFAAVAMETKKGGFEFFFRFLSSNFINWRIFVFWRPFWIQNGLHSKLTMDINSQHYNLLGNQISPTTISFQTYYANSYLIFAY